MTMEKKFFDWHFFINSIKEYWFIGLIIFSGYFYLIPNETIKSIKYYNKNGGDLLTYFDDFSISNILTSFHCFCALVVAIVFSLVLFNSIHNKKQMDFFHSQPIRKETLIFVRYITGLIIFAAALGLNYMLSCLIMLFGGVGEAINIIEILGHFGYVSLLFAVIMGLGALAAVLCGTTFAQFNLMVIMLFALPIVYWCFIVLCETLLATFYTTSVIEITVYLSPYLHFAYKCGCAPLGNALMSPGEIAIYIAAAIGLLGLAAWLYKKVPIESIGMPLVFKATRPIIKYTACFITASIFGMIFNMEVFEFMIVGAAIGGWLCHSFCESIFNRNIRFIFKNTIGFTIFTVLMIGLLFGLAFDVIGFNKRVPDAANVKSVKINNFDTERYTIMKSRIIQNKLKDSKDYENREFIELACALSNEMGKDAISTQSRKWLIDIKRQNLLSFEIAFEMQDGSIINRKYSAAKTPKIFELYNKMINSEEYKRGYSVFHIDDGVKEIEINGGKNIKSKVNINRKLDKEDSKMLLEALRLDILDSTKMHMASTVCTISVNNYIFSILIKDDYKRAKELLIQWGILKEYTYEEYSEIYSSVKIIGQDGKSLIIMPDEKERFKEIMDCATDYEKRMIDTRFYVEFEQKIQKEQKFYNQHQGEVATSDSSVFSIRHMPYGGVPQFAKDYFEIE